MARRTPSATPSRTPSRTLSHTPSRTPSLGVAVGPIDPLQVLVDTRRPLPPHCPHCGGAPLIRWGAFSGRQRYRCKACGRTSSDLTGTALAYTKKLPLWGEFAAGMLEGESCRAGARRLGIDKTTAWRWRHRLLERL
ncbi:MAG: IS1 family transposase, partial [Gemmatimonadetes bacterium]|nr:IS1 family transposase [Gemmatimonadota bacterium]